MAPKLPSSISNYAPPITMRDFMETEHRHGRQGAEILHRFLAREVDSMEQALVRAFEMGYNEGAMRGSSHPNATQKREQEKEDAYQEGFDQGYDEGYQDGWDEAGGDDRS